MGMSALHFPPLITPFPPPHPSENTSRPQFEVVSITLLRFSHTCLLPGAYFLNMLGRTWELYFFTVPIVYHSIYFFPSVILASSFFDSPFSFPLALCSSLLVQVELSVPSPLLLLIIFSIARGYFDVLRR